MAEIIETRCCVAGGGPAGMMVGYLLARMGIDVVVLEKHADFLRDFRGDTIHPSTLDIMHELGLLTEFLKRPHQQVEELQGKIGDDVVTIGDFRHVPTYCKFLALMPQWDFLDFLKEHATRYSGFHLRVEAEVTDVIEEGGAITGVRAQTPGGLLEVRADVVIGADGRHSVVREQAGLEAEDIGAPMDVLWMRLSRQEGDPHLTFGHVNYGRILVLINRDTYWQAAFVVPKGEGEKVRERGIEAFREEIARFEPFLRERVGELREWKDVSQLTVRVDRLTEWAQPGLLCIGDAAHAMSPVGGVGINLAIQDAVATANILGPVLAKRKPALEDLRAVQARREFPTRATQAVQVAVQNNIIRRVFEGGKQLSLPWPLKLLRALPVLRRIPARIVGVGFRPEHVRTPDIRA